MFTDWMTWLFYMLLGALALLALQYLTRIVHRSISRNPDPESGLGRRLDFTVGAIDQFRAGPISERLWLWDNLTAREMEIARLVAQGKRNLQVAHELEISPYTVETHLKHIYVKLHVRSRTELAHAVRELVD